MDYFTDILLDYFVVDIGALVRVHQCQRSISDGYNLDHSRLVSYTYFSGNQI